MSRDPSRHVVPVDEYTEMKNSRDNYRYFAWVLGAAFIVDLVDDILRWLAS